MDLSVKVIGIANGGKDYKSLRSIRKKLVMLTVENQNRKNKGRSCPIQRKNNNTCQSCGKKGEDGENLDVHHIYPLNDWIDDGHDPNDYPDDWLMTLDKSCHSKADAQDGDFKYPLKEE